MEKFRKEWAAWPVEAKGQIIINILHLNFETIKVLTKHLSHQRQQNKCYPQRCLLDHFEVTLDFTRIANLLAHNNISQICYCGQFSLQRAAVDCSSIVNLTHLRVTFILLVMVHVSRREKKLFSSSSIRRAEGFKILPLWQMGMTPWQPLSQKKGGGDNSGTPKYPTERRDKNTPPPRSLICIAAPGEISWNFSSIYKGTREKISLRRDACNG